MFHFSIRDCLLAVPLMALCFAWVCEKGRVETMQSSRDAPATAKAGAALLAAGGCLKSEADAASPEAPVRGRNKPPQSA